MNTNSRPAATTANQDDDDGILMTILIAILELAYKVGLLNDATIQKYQAEHEARLNTAPTIVSSTSSRLQEKEVEDEDDDDWDDLFDRRTSLAHVDDPMNIWYGLDDQDDW